MKPNDLIEAYIASKRGHELSGENVWISNGSRICKTCQKTRTFLNGERAQTTAERGDSSTEEASRDHS